MSWMIAGNSEDRLLRLAYCPPAATLVAHFERALHPRHVTRSLYVRRVGAEEGVVPQGEYSALCVGSSKRSYHSFAVADATPNLFVEELVAADDGVPTAGWKTRAIVRIGLEAMCADARVEQDTFEPRGLRLGHIVGVGPSADEVVCYVGAGRGSEYAPGSYIASVHVVTSLETKMVRLSNSHF